MIVVKSFTHQQLHIPLVTIQKSILPVSIVKFYHILFRDAISDFPWRGARLQEKYLSPPPPPNIFSQDFAHYFFQFLIFYIYIYFFFLYFPEKKLNKMENQPIPYFKGLQNADIIIKIHTHIFNIFRFILSNKTSLFV